MSSRELFFHPFDVTYGEVSRRARQMLETLSAQDEERWMRAIIWQFQVEADRWDHKPELAQYRAIMEKLPLKVLCLAGAAYLHICYDLPRVLANEWPGTPPNDPPSLARGRQIYDAIGRFFPEVINEVGIMPEIVGISGPMLQWQEARRVMRLWIVDLRGAAWAHGQILQQLPPARRLAVEREMLDVLAEALGKISGWVPWRVLHLLPPDDAFERARVKLYQGALPLIPIDIVGSRFMVPLEWLTLLTSLATLGFVVVQQVQSRRKATRQDGFRLREMERRLPPEKIDSIIAEVIDKLGHEIRGGMKRVFSDFGSPLGSKLDN